MDKLNSGARECRATGSVRLLGGSEKEGAPASVNAQYGCWADNGCSEASLTEERKELELHSGRATVAETERAAVCLKRGQ